MGRKPLIVIAFIILGLNVNVASVNAAPRGSEKLPDAIPENAQEAVVQEVRDGRTLVALVNGKRKLIRLVGIDTPNPKAKPLGECYAQEAIDHLSELAAVDTTIYLESDAKDRDEEGRLLRYVWVPGAAGAKPVLANGRMIRDGYAAWLVEEDNYRYESTFERFEKEAKDRNRGIWKSCDGPHKKIEPPPPSEDELKAQYSPLADVRELVIRPGGLLGQKITFAGNLLDIAVASPGRVFVLGDADPQAYSAWLQVWVYAPDGTQEVVSVGFNGDTTGMFKDSYVVIWGTVVDTVSGTNAFGGSIAQPLVSAEFAQLG